MSKNTYVTAMTKSVYNRFLNRGERPRCYSCGKILFVDTGYATQISNHSGIKRRCIPCAKKYGVI